MKLRNINYSAVANVSTQLVGYIVPLVTYPYLGRTLGASSFGVMSFWLALAGFSSIVAEYGFRYSAARDIARSSNAGESSSIYWNVQIARFLILLVLIITGSIFSYFWSDHGLYFFILASVLTLGGVIFPSWYFIGSNQYKAMALLISLPRFLSLIATFVLVHSPSDVAIALLIQGLPMLISGIAAHIFLFSNKKIGFSKISLFASMKSLWTGRSEFVSVLAMSSYQSLPVILLGVTSSSIQIANYAIADKLIQAAKSVCTAWGQTIFTRNSSKTSEMSLDVFKQDVRVFIFINFLAFVSLNFVGFFIPRYLGEGYGSLQGVLFVMSFIPFAAGFSNVAGIQTLMPLNRARKFMLCTLVAGVLGISAGFVLSFWFNEYGMSIGVLISESVLALSLTWFAMALLIEKDRGRVRG